MKELTIKNTTQSAIVDDEDYERLLQYNWRVSAGGTIQYAYTKCSKTRVLAIANIIMHKDGSIMFDHIDRNPYNNQKANLRECSCSENMMNRPKRKGSISKYKGVSWHKVRKKWRARIKIRSNEIALGYYNNEEEAARAYDKAAIELFKQFAYLNFPTI